jgi:hypothetical protein
VDGEPLSVRPEPRLVVTANQAAIAAAGTGWVPLSLVLSGCGQIAAGELEIILADFEMPPLPIMWLPGGRNAPARFAVLSILR